MRAPHYFIHGNLVFAAGPDDVWAGFKLDGASYPGLSIGRKIELKERLESLAYAIEADFQLMRVSRAWSADRYVEKALTTLDPRRGHPAEFRAYLECHRELLRSRRVVRPETYLFVYLGAGNGEPFGSRLAGMARRLEQVVGLSESKGISRSRLEELRRSEERTFDRVFDYVPCERARSGEIASLIRAPYGRGLGALGVDPNWRPQAFWIDRAETEEGLEDSDEPQIPEPVFEPYTHDLMRLHESRVEVGPRSLQIHTELGVSHQAMLVCGALPDYASFPGSDVELLFTPLEVGFPVDVTFSAEFVTNKAAQKLAQKRMVDADQAAIEESHGQHGPSVRTHENTYAARDLQARLGSSDRPPLLRSAMVLGVGAPSEELLEERIERLRSEFGRTELHRPLGEQHRLFLGAMPAQRFPVPDYRSHLLPEQFGAMVPTAISHAGSDVGPYLGHTLTGSRQPVQFDLAEACKTSRPPTVLVSGSLGAGKTMALQTLLYQAFLQGSTPIVDIDPKGDHNLTRFEVLRGEVEEIELGPDDRYRGLLDPMRIGTADRRADLTNNFLTSILPEGTPAGWRTEIRAAIGIVDADCGRTTGDVLAELERGGEDAREAARALKVHLTAGLARLGYAEHGTEIPKVGGAQVISMRIRNLSLPQAGTSRSEHQEDERVSAAVLRLLAAYALRLCAADTESHAVLALDEAWALLGDSQGQALVNQFSRMGRSMNITPILASQIVADAEAMEGLIGAYLAFGVETESEAEAALRLLRLDAGDSELQQRMLGFRAGRCYLRDFEGRTVPMRVDPGAALLDGFDTTPKRAEDSEDLPERGGAVAA